MKRVALLALKIVLFPIFVVLIGAFCLIRGFAPWWDSVVSYFEEPLW